MRNDDFQTPLDVARVKGCANVVRALEVCVKNLKVAITLKLSLCSLICSKLYSLFVAFQKHVCYFSGWLREFYGPSFLEALAPKLLSGKMSV